MAAGRGRGRTTWPQCVAAGPFLFVAGQTGVAPRGRTPVASFDEVAGLGPGANGSHAWVNAIEGPVGGQGIAIYERLRALLGKASCDLGDLVRYHILQRDKRHFPVFDRVRRHYESAPPASTAVGTGRFDAADQARLLVDGIAYAPAGAKDERRKVLGGSASHTSAATYSQLIGAGPYLFMAGQIPIDTSKPGAPLIRGYADVPEQGRFLSVGRSHEDTRNGPIAAQTWFTYDLVRRHLERAGASMQDILNLTVYLQDMRDFPTFHRVHERFFPDAPPALTVVAVGEVGHKGTLIEIEPTALMPGRGIARSAHAGAERFAHMSEVVEAGGLAFVSAAAGVDASGRPVARKSDLPASCRNLVSGRGVTGVQTAMIVARLGQALARAGGKLDRIVHLAIHLSNIEDRGEVEQVLARAFPRKRPVLVVLEVPAPSPVAGARVSIAAIAWLGAGTARTLA